MSVIVELEWNLLVDWVKEGIVVSCKCGVIVGCLWIV